MFENVLVCLDGSPLSEQILPYIVGEGRSFHQVTLLRVVANPDTAVPIGVPGAPGVPVHTETMLQAFQKELAAAPDYLERLAQPLRDKGLFVRCVVLQGSANEVIVNYAKGNAVTLIAIASHGHGGLRRVIFGSTAEYVMRNSGLPLFVIRPR